MLRGVEIVRHADRSATMLACDAIVTAGARAPDARPFAPEIALDGDGLIVVDPDTLQTPMFGVWAGGACAFGHRSIAHAAADGKRAAWDIHGALVGQPVRVAIAAAWVEADDWDPARAARSLGTPPLDTASHAPSAVDPFSATAARPDADAAREATRCYDCTVVPVVDEHCTSCGKCVGACPEGAFQMQAGPPKQLRLDADLCTRCGICVQKCPEGAISMLRAVWEQRLTDHPADNTAPSRSSLAAVTASTRAVITQ